MLLVAVSSLARAATSGAETPWATPWDLRPATRDNDQAGLQPTTPALVKSLGDAAELLQHHSPPTNAAAWHARRPQVERALRRSLGLDPLPTRTPLNARTLAVHDRGAFTVATVIFESRPEFPVTANLYRPKTEGGAAVRRPAVLSPIGHFLSAGKTATDVQARCLHLARLGYVVLTYDALGQGERMFAGNVHHDAGYALLPLGETIAGWMVWDSLRALDYLASLEDVDPQRLGITGNSGGGLNSLLTAALDERVQAAAVVGFTFEFRHWIKYGGTHCTCTHFPGIFQAMEWADVGGLIAPRRLLMLQGAEDRIFPIAGARRAAAGTAQIYSVLNAGDHVRFVELAGQPHAYTRPFREVMYDWMNGALSAPLSRVSAPPSLAEDPSLPWPEKDRRLLVDPDRTFLPSSPTVVDLARRRALEEILPRLAPPGANSGAVTTLVARLVAAPEDRTGFLNARTWVRTNLPSARQEKVSFTSEDGVWIPGVLTLPASASTNAPVRVVVIAHEQGKAAVLDTDLVTRVIQAGRAVLALDVRGAGESLGHFGPRYNTHFRLVANQVLLGQPLAGRRAFDLRRAVDFLAGRPEVSLDDLAAVGVGGEALTVLLAATVDPRIRRVAVDDYFASFASAMAARVPPAPENFGDAWNDPQLDGRVNTGPFTVDFGGAIPAVLADYDVPDLLAALAPRPVLFGARRDAAIALPDIVRQRFEAAVARWPKIAPGRNSPITRREAALDGPALAQWLSP